MMLRFLRSDATRGAARFYTLGGAGARNSSGTGHADCGDRNICTIQHRKASASVKLMWQKRITTHHPLYSLSISSTIHTLTQLTIRTIRSVVVQYKLKQHVPVLALGAVLERVAPTAPRVRNPHVHHEHPVLVDLVHVPRNVRYRSVSEQPP